MATLDELKAAYPGIPDALEVSEIKPELWESARAAGLSPAEVIAAHQVATAALALQTALDPGLAPTADLVNRLLEQLQHPNYRRYVAGKLGAV